jgi:exodeoxyribonuclease VII small subunit
MSPERPSGPEPDAEEAALDRLSYEELVETLEDLTKKMSSGEVGIEEAAELYARAGRVHRAALTRLQRVRQRIEALDSEADGGS